MMPSRAHNLPLSFFDIVSRARVRAASTLPEGGTGSVDPDSGADPPPVSQKKPPSRGSPQLRRWSRARTLRSGRKLDRRSAADKERFGSPASSQVSFGSSWVGEEVDELGEDEVGGGAAKAIYMVSDGTGSTVENSVGAALGQFDYCLVDRGCPVNTHLFSGIDDLNRLMEVIKQAAKEGALLLYTLADPSMAEAAKKACKLWGVPFADILGPITEAIAAHLGVVPSGIPRGAAGRNKPLSEEYFRGIEAIDFTIKQDDGAQPKNLNKAHIVLVGVSRTGKTPLSIYLAQKGYKVANVPIVMGLPLPKMLFEINQDMIYALTINPFALQTIRKSRANSLHFSREMASRYSDIDHVREELEYASKIFAQNPLWPVIEVTQKAIEETAAVILRTFHDRKHKYTMPCISKRY